MALSNMAEILNSSFFLVALKHDHGPEGVCDLASYSSFRELKNYDSFVRSIQGGVYDEVWVYPYEVKPGQKEDDVIMEYGNLLLDTIETEGTKVLAEDGFNVDIEAFVDKY